MNKSLNIWTIYQFSGTPDMPGSERSYQFAKAFAKKGNHVTLWTSSYSHWGNMELIDDDTAFIIKKEGNLSIIYLKTKPLYSRNDYKRFTNMIYFAYTLLKTSKDIISPPDVIIASYPSPFAALAAYRLSVRYRAKFIVEIRDLWPRVWVERKAFSRFHPFILTLYAVEKFLYKRTRIFVTALPYVNDYLHERGIKPKSISWIPNGINLEDFKFAEKQHSLFEENNNILDIMKSEKENGKMNVIYVGGIGVGNRVDCIIEAAKILWDKGEHGISFFIIGEGHSKKELIKYVANNELKNVQILAAIPRKAVPKVLCYADVGIMCLHDNPVYRYGVNLNKIYDYMAASIPVVFSANVRNNLVKSSEAGITVPPGNSDEIAKALERFKVMTKEERDLMGEKGYKVLLEDYNVSTKLSKNYLDFIESSE